MKPVSELDALADWVRVVERLSQSQKLLLIGLIVRNPGITAQLINLGLINESENLSASSSWFTEKFRDVLYFYCKHSTDLKVEGALAGLDKTGVGDLVKNLAQALLIQLYLPIGIAVSVLHWLIKRSATDWCDKYKIQEYGGVGFVLSTTDTTDPLKIEGYMDLKHKPAILEIEADIEAMPLKVPNIRIAVPEENSGRLKVRNQSDVYKMIRFNEEGAYQNFMLRDSQTKKDLCWGDVTSAFPIAAETDILGFATDKLIRPTK